MRKDKYKMKKEMKTTYVEIPLYPENDAIFHSGRWDEENRLLAFDMTDEELYKVKEVYDKCEGDWDEVVDFIINTVDKDNQYISEFWGCEGVYVDDIDFLEEILENLTIS